MAENPYRVVTRSEPEGGLRFEGPGLSRYEVTLRVTDHERDRISVMLAKAFKAGRQAMASEIRNLLGVQQ